MAEYISIVSINFDARYARTYEVDVKQDGSYSATFNMGNKELISTIDAIKLPVNSTKFVTIYR